MLAGVLVSEAVRKTGIESVPIVGEIISSFCGSFVTGILSCVTVYFLDRNPYVKKLVDFLNRIDPFYEANKLIDYLKKQAVYFEEYVACLMEISIEKFKKDVAECSLLANRVENAKNEAELTSVLYVTVEHLNVKMQWGGEHENVDDYMREKVNSGFLDRLFK